jgi:hypothetical protein
LLRALDGEGDHESDDRDQASEHVRALERFGIMVSAIMARIAPAATAVMIATLSGGAD